MKVALIFSGHFRPSWIQCYPSWQNLINAYQPKIFFHTWSNEGRFIRAEFVNAMDANDFGTAAENDAPIDIDHILSRYPADLYEVTDHNDVREEIKKITKPIYAWRETLDTLYHNYRINSYLSTYYTVMKSVQLKQQYERMNNMKFDMCIMSRPDVALSSLPLSLDLSKVHVNERGTHLINDHIDNIVFMTNSENCDIIGNVYNEFSEKFEEAKRTNDPSRLYEPHRLYFKLITDNCISIVPSLTAAIVR